MKLHPYSLDTTPLFHWNYTPIPSNLHPYSIETTPLFPRKHTPIPSKLNPYPLESTPLFPRNYTPIPSKQHPYSLEFTPLFPRKHTPIPSTLHPFPLKTTHLFLETIHLFLETIHLFPRNFTPIPGNNTPIPQSLHPYFSEGGRFPYIWIMNNLPKCLALPKSQSLRIPLSGSRSKFWGLISLNNIQSKSYLSKLTVDMIIIYHRLIGMFNSQWYPWKLYIIENEWDIHILNFKNWLFSIFILFISYIFWKLGALISHLILVDFCNSNNER